MSHFGRSGPPDIRDTYSLLVLNITFRTTADDLYPLFDKYGKVVDVFIPRDRRTGDSRGFAFVRYKYADEAQKAIDKLDGRMLDGREIMVQFAKYGPNAEKIRKGKVMESSSSKTRGRSRSRSPRPRHRDDYRDRDYRRRSRSRSRERYDRDRPHRSEREHHRSRSRSASPDRNKDRRRERDDERHSASRSERSMSPTRHSPDTRRSISPRRTPSRGRSDDEHSPQRENGSLDDKPVDSRSPSPAKSDADE
ncbi:serine/arginine-rich splicing factor SC35-like isoform X2 [Cucurbita maxima]|uniref:Serine/arginine-rich splicing factor SC35-like isoform X2 n=1 Tax=Cucurbita maxima TaxID=3661 RepID=A0A6J1KK62_CUCMA|nr:serine/arginine-rich splicing factor SC35-like isoform X2 [Cucurbita maxima]